MPTPIAPARFARPSRASFMTGQLPHRTGVCDNAAEFASDIPDLCPSPAPRRLPDPPFGQDAFRRPRPASRFRGTADDGHLSRRFRLDPDYRKPGERIDWWYHNLGSVTGAGVAEITNQYEYDDEVAYNACRKHDLSRARTTGHGA